MRIAIFSDVHSNIVALRAVLESYSSRDIDEYICLGDVVGYGSNPDECATIVRELVSTCIMGNHDAAVAGEMDYTYYYDAARNALDYHAVLVSKENRDWLKALPYTVERDDICFSHGSPVDPRKFDYVFNEEQARGLLPSFDSLKRVTFIGHSHLTRAFAINVEQAVPVREVTGPLIQLEEGWKYIVTVGSVGQPRDNDARACSTIFDTEKDSIEYIRTDYDIAESARRILKAGPLAADFGKRLFLGI